MWFSENKYHENEKRSTGMDSHKNMKQKTRGRKRRTTSILICKINRDLKQTKEILVSASLAIRQIWEGEIV